MRNRILGLIAVVSTVLLGTTVVEAENAHAATFGVDYYIAAPFVQGSYVTTGQTLETFDAQNVGACQSPLAVGTVTGDCLISTGGAYGGATTDSATPTVGDPSARTKYATTASPSQEITLSFSDDQKYLGFWWSAGSPTNTVTFFDGTTEVLELTTGDLISVLGDAPAGTYGTTGAVTAISGTAYTKHYYFGHPAGYTTTTPTVASTITPAEPFMYLHVFTSGGLTFDSLTLSGSGFEFDNFMVSTLEQTPDNSLVRIGSIQSSIDPPTTQTSNVDPERDDVVGPAIALTPQFGVGDRACGADVFIEGFGLRSGASYSLRYRAPERVLGSGTVDANGNFVRTLGLPASLSQGSHTLSLVSTTSEGDTIQLVRTFTTDGNCVVTYLDNGMGSRGAPQQVLASTGSGVPWALLAVSLLTLTIGGVLAGRGRRVERSST